MIKVIIYDIIKLKMFDVNWSILKLKIILSSIDKCMENKNVN